MNMHVPANTAMKPSEIVAEYEKKLAALDDAFAVWERAGDSLKMAATIGGTWGMTSIDTGRVCERDLRRSLLTSAWRHLYKTLHIERLASADDKRRFEQSMADPAEFTLDNIRATFGEYIADPRGSIIRGLAEAFCALDPAYKSHEKVKIGVKGLPKRVILSSVGGYGSYGRDRLENILNALACYQAKPLVDYADLNAILKDEDALREERGVYLRRFQNGNGHLYFEPDTLRDINLALAEFYGDVLPDAAEEVSTEKQKSRAVSKDLQYYPTPMDVVERVLAEIYQLEEKRVLEPSCGCGRFMDALKAHGAHVVGYEFDNGRAEQCRSKGHSVLTANFLETVPTGDFDEVVMNPPFYGKHYALHVFHALKFLKPGGRLTAILPSTARYDHGLINGRWYDLPLGSFSESGTNINTSVVTIWKQ